MNLIKHGGKRQSSVATCKLAVCSHGEQEALGIRSVLDTRNFFFLMTLRLFIRIGKILI